MPAAPRVTVVVVSWNALPLLKQCLPSVAATDYPNLEVVLADNASTDGSAAWVADALPAVRVLRHPENWLFCRGNNEAVRQTEGRYVVLLNNDVEVPPGWLAPLVEAMEREPSVAAVQPKLLQHTDRSRFEYAGACGGFLDRHGYPFTRGRLFDTMERDHGQYDDACDIFWATGAALTLRRSALNTVGLLDERFEMHMEEIDLCWRLWRAGYRVRVEPASEVYHIGGSSLPPGSPRKAYYNFRNSLLTLYKNLPPRAWTPLFLQRTAMDAAAAARLAAQGRGAEAAAVVRAYRDAHRMKEAYRRTRPSDDEPALLPSYRSSVVADYFVRRRRHFADLPDEHFRLLGLHR